MEKALWYLLAGTRGGTNRARIVRALSERPRNANQLAERLDVDYNTVRHHLDMLKDHDVIEPGGGDYGKLYFLTDRFEHHREEFERIIEQVDIPAEPEPETDPDTDADAGAGANPEGDG
jgi:DNA-binding transcriptional ArsR family regulator